MRGEFNGPQKLIHDENPYMPSAFIVLPINYSWWLFRCQDVAIVLRISLIVST
jgi:hypothetical protein